MLSGSVLTPIAAWARQAAIALTAALAIAGANPPARAESTTTTDLAAITLRIGDQKGGARSLLEAAGLDKDFPYKVEWREFPAAAPLLEALNAGAIDVGTAGDAPMIFAQAAGVPLKVVVAYRYDPVGTAVVVPGASPIRTAADLKGKRIATGKGSIGHHVALAALEQAGLTPADYTLVFLTPVDAKLALSTGSVDAWATWEPYTSQVELVDGARSVADARGLSSGLTYTVATVSAIADKRAALADLADRLVRARLWALDHVEPYAASLSQLIGVPPAVAARWTGRAQYRAVPIDADVIAGQQRTIDLYHRFGVIRSHIDAADGFDATFNDTVIKASGGK